MTNRTEDDLRAALSADAEAGAPPIDVWSRLQRRRARQQRMRAGLALTGAAAVVATVLLALPGHDDATVLPPAASDVRTLVPDRPMSDAELQKAVDTFRHRLDSLGVQHATISTQDDAVLIEASGTTRSDIAAIAVRGELQFRLVKTVGPATDCSSSSDVACSADGNVQYTLGPVALDNSDVQHADVVQNSIDGSWLVVLGFDAAGADKFHTLTAEAAAELDQGVCQPPQACGEIAIVVDGTVLEAPTVQQSGGISGGQTQISGAVTKEDAQTLAALATSGPLPTRFSLSG